MKTLKEQIDLLGEIEVITVTELRSRPGECLTQVSLGKTFCITRNGKPVAFLAPSADIGHEILPDGSCVTLGLKARP